MMTIEINSKRRLFEIVAVIITGFSKILFVDVFPYKFWFILVAILFWVSYIIVRSNGTPGILRHWGFTSNNFKSTSLVILPYATISIIGFLVYGLVKETAVINWHIIPIMLLYPIWGVIQQFLVIALIAGNLNELHSFKIRGVWIILITAILFSIVHYPSFYLIIATFLLAIFYTIIYLKSKNLWVLGIFHGWLGGLFYFLVLGRDPWVEVFGSF